MSDKELNEFPYAQCYNYCYDKDKDKEEQTLITTWNVNLNNNNIINSMNGTNVFSTISFFSCFILFTYSDNLGSSISSSISVIEYCFDKRNSSLNDSSR